jgi:hypothetical protein
MSVQQLQPVAEELFDEVEFFPTAYVQSQICYMLVDGIVADDSDFLYYVPEGNGLESGSGRFRYTSPGVVESYDGFKFYIRYNFPTGLYLGEGIRLRLQTSSSPTDPDAGTIHFLTGADGNGWVETSAPITGSWDTKTLTLTAAEAEALMDKVLGSEPYVWLQFWIKVFDQATKQYKFSWFQLEAPESCSPECPKHTLSPCLIGFLYWSIFCLTWTNPPDNDPEETITIQKCPDGSALCVDDDDFDDVGTVEPGDDEWEDENLYPTLNPGDPPNPPTPCYRIKSEWASGTIKYSEIYCPTLSQVVAGTINPYCEPALAPYMDIDEDDQTHTAEGAGTDPSYTDEGAGGATSYTNLTGSDPGYTEQTS